MASSITLGFISFKPYIPSLPKLTTLDLSALSLCQSIKYLAIHKWSNLSSFPSNSIIINSLLTQI